MGRAPVRTMPPELLHEEGERDFGRLVLVSTVLASSTELVTEPLRWELRL